MICSLAQAKKSSEIFIAQYSLTDVKTIVSVRLISSCQFSLLTSSMA